MMRKLAIVFAVSIFIGSSAYAGLWENNCSSCHNGNVAPTKEAILQKYKTASAFMSAVRRAVLSGKMPRGLEYSLVATELYGSSSTFQGRRGVKSLPTLPTAEIEGKITNIEKVTGFGKGRFQWWVIDVKTKKRVISVWLIPVQRFPSIGLKPGDKVKVKAFIPLYWRAKGTNEVMACIVKNETSGTILDFSFKPPCERLK